MKPFCYHSFDLRQLVSFAEIARAGSFRQAAKTLHIAQPALSQAIAQLESDLGVTLLKRHPRGVTLTPAGTEFLVKARRLGFHVKELPVSHFPRTAGSRSLRVGLIARWSRSSARR